MDLGRERIYMLHSVAPVIMEVEIHQQLLHSKQDLSFDASALYQA